MTTETSNADARTIDLATGARQLIVIGFGAVVAAAGFYFVRFGYLALHQGTQETWGQFGDFVGGIVNPFIGLLTFGALAISIILQSRQLQTSSDELRLSRLELELTRKELTRTAEAQLRSEVALAAHAESAESSTRLGLISFLLARYDEEQRLLAHGDRARLVEERQRELTRIVDGLYEQVTSPVR